MIFANEIDFLEKKIFFGYNMIIQFALMKIFESYKKTTKLRRQEWTGEHRNNKKKLEIKSLIKNDRLEFIFLFFFSLKFTSINDVLIKLFSKFNVLSIFFKENPFLVVRFFILYA